MDATGSGVGLLHVTCPPKGCWMFHIPPATISESMPPNPTAPVATASVTPFIDKQFGYLNVYEVFPPHYPQQVFGACLAADASLQLPQLPPPKHVNTSNGKPFTSQPCALWTYDDWYGTFVAEEEFFLDVSRGIAPAQNEAVPTTLIISIAPSTLATISNTTTQTTPSPAPTPQHNLTAVSRWEYWPHGKLSKTGGPLFFQRSDDPGVLYVDRLAHGRTREWYVATSESVERGGPLRWESGADDGRMFIVKFETPMAGAHGDWKSMPGE